MSAKNTEEKTERELREYAHKQLKLISISRFAYELGVTNRSNFIKWLKGKRNCDVYTMNAIKTHMTQGSEHMLSLCIKKEEMTHIKKLSDFRSTCENIKNQTKVLVFIDADQANIHLLQQIEWIHDNMPVFGFHLILVRTQSKKIPEWIISQQLKHNWIHIFQSGQEKDAADIAIAIQLGIAHTIFNEVVEFVIWSNDRLCEAMYNEIRLFGRKTFLINPAVSKLAVFIIFQYWHMLTSYELSRKIVEILRYENMCYIDKAPYIEKLFNESGLKYFLGNKIKRSVETELERAHNDPFSSLQKILPLYKNYICLPPIDKYIESSVLDEIRDIVPSPNKPPKAIDDAIKNRLNIEKRRDLLKYTRLIRYLEITTDDWYNVLELTDNELRFEFALVYGNDIEGFLKEQNVGVNYPSLASWLSRGRQNCYASSFAVRHWLLKRSRTAYEK